MFVVINSIINATSEGVIRITGGDFINWKNASQLSEAGQDWHKPFNQ